MFGLFFILFLHKKNIWFSFSFVLPSCSAPTNAKQKYLSLSSHLFLVGFCFLHRYFLIPSNTLYFRNPNNWQGGRNKPIKTIRLHSTTNWDGKRQRWKKEGKMVEMEGKGKEEERTTSAVFFHREWMLGFGSCN